MVSEERIRKQLNNVLDSTDFKWLGKCEKGKVRDSYVLDRKRVLVVTDRISAFDVVLGRCSTSSRPSGSRKRGVSWQIM
jgi:hypothetical protein